MSVVKKRVLILPLFSVFLALIFMVGSTGVNIIIHNCKSCGISVTSRVFEPVSLKDGKCCMDHDSHASPDGSAVMENGCCTLTNENLKITNYVAGVKHILFPAHNISPISFASFVPRDEKAKVISIFVYNKHGGQDVIISNCQILI